MKNISYIIQSKAKSSQLWRDEPFADLTLDTGLQKLAVLRPANLSLQFQLVRRVAVVTDKPVKEKKP